MQQRASLRELNEIVRNIGTHVLSSMFGLFAGLFIVAGMMIMLSFVFMTELGLRPAVHGDICACHSVRHGVLYERDVLL